MIDCGKNNLKTTSKTMADEDTISCGRYRGMSISHMEPASKFHPTSKECFGIVSNYSIPFSSGLIKIMNFESRAPIALGDLKGHEKGLQADLNVGWYVDHTLLDNVPTDDPLRQQISILASIGCSRDFVARMATEANWVTTQAITKDCGIGVEGDLILEGDQFRALGDNEQRVNVPRLQVFKRTGPDDKRKIIISLKELG